MGSLLSVGILGSWEVSWVSVGSLGSPVSLGSGEDIRGHCGQWGQWVNGIIGVSGVTEINGICGVIGVM